MAPDAVSGTRCSLSATVSSTLTVIMTSNWITNTIPVNSQIGTGSVSTVDVLFTENEQLR